MAEKLTACRECKHLKTTEVQVENSGHYYIDHRCVANRYQGLFDYFTGSYGIGAMKPCSSVNIDGHCPSWEAK